jgi:hypothetical protein
VKSENIVEVVLNYAVVGLGSRSRTEGQGKLVSIQMCKLTFMTGECMVWLR